MYNDQWERCNQIFPLDFLRNLHTHSHRSIPHKFFIRIFVRRTRFFTDHPPLHYLGLLSRTHYHQGKSCDRKRGQKEEG